MTVRTAVPVPTGPDAGRPWHYGDPVGEQRAWLAGTGLVELGDRGVLRVDGPDRLTWLHDLTTQRLADLQPGQPTETLVLSPHGHVEHALHLVDDGTTTWITVEPGTVSDLGAWLDSMRFLLRVDVTDVTDEWAVVAQPAAAELPAPSGPPAWTDPWPRVAEGSTSYAPADAPHPADGVWQVREVLVPRSDLGTVVDGTPPTGRWAYEALRVEARRPRLGFETDHRTIPHEVDWLRTAVHLNKGCYRGQETVARVHNLGRPPRRLVLLHLDGSEVALPERGADVLLEGRRIGHLTTVARHHELGPVALGVVKRTVPTDALLTAGDVVSSQEVVVAP